MGLTISTKYVANHAITGTEVVMLKAVWGDMELVEGEYYKDDKRNGPRLVFLPIPETLQESQLPEAQRILRRPDVERSIFMRIKSAFEEKV